MTAPWDVCVKLKQDNRYLGQLISYRNKMPNFKPHLSWETHTKEISSLTELEALLDALSQKTPPTFSVELYMSASTGLLITLGESKSHVEYYSQGEHPPVISCLGENDSDEVYYFLHHGELSSVSGRSCVSIEKARDAMRIYFLTKEKPNNIDW